MTPETPDFNKTELDFIDCYATVTVEKFKLRNLERAKEALHLDGGPMPQLIRDQEEALELQKNHLLRVVVEHKDDLVPKMETLKEAASEKVASRIARHRHSVEAYTQKESERLLVGRWANENDIFREAKRNLDSNQYQGAMWGVNVPQSTNKHLTSLLNDFYQLAIEQFGMNMRLDTEVVMPFGAKEILNMETYPRASLGDLKNTVNSLNQEGVLHLNANEIIHEAQDSLSRREIHNRSDIIQELMQDIEAELPLRPASEKEAKMDDDPSFRF